ncbi:hypothetical protein GCM10010174_78950 [Kutzneria viridogrisea]
MLRNGLPLVIKGNGGFPLFVRMLPVLLAVLSFKFFDALGDLLLPDGDTDFTVNQMLLIVASFLGLLVSVTVVPLAGVRLRDRVRWLRTGTASPVVAGVFVVGYLAAGGLAEHSPQVLALSAVQVAVILVLGYVLVATGVAAIMVWSARRAWQQLATVVHLSTRAIPMLLLLVTFLFVSPANWMMAASLPRSQVWSVILVFFVVMLLFLSVRLPDELRALTVDLGQQTATEACAGTPLEGFPARIRYWTKHPLRRRERANVVLILLIGQVVQVVLLGVLLWVFFMVFGHIAVRPEVMEKWVGHPPTSGTVFGVPVPVSNELIQVSIVIAGFASLYFAIYEVTDAKYRAEFFDVLIVELDRTLLVRECYLTLLETDVDNATTILPPPEDPLVRPDWRQHGQLE